MKQINALIRAIAQMVVLFFLTLSLSIEISFFHTHTHTHTHTFSLTYALTFAIQFWRRRTLSIYNLGIKTQAKMQSTKSVYTRLTRPTFWSWLKSLSNHKQKSGVRFSLVRIRLPQLNTASLYDCLMRMRMWMNMFMRESESIQHRQLVQLTAFFF